jgi:predicted metal-dependent hydrolase
MNTKLVNIGSIGEVAISKNRKASRFKITIRHDGKIRVTIPWLASFLNGEKFLFEHLQWITQTREKLAKKHIAPKLIQVGHLFSTRNYHYHVCQADITGLRIRYVKEEKSVFFEYPNNQLIESDDTQKKLRVMVENVLRSDARQYLPARIAKLASELGYTYRKVTIKNNKTNWGSCSGQKNINLNLHLMRLNDTLIDYIIIHELVHTVIPNHGPGFKTTMQKHFQNITGINKELKKEKTGIF